MYIHNVCTNNCKFHKTLTTHDQFTKAQHNGDVYGHNLDYEVMTKTNVHKI